MENKSFYEHHSAFGAFSSFILGKFGMGGGFVLNDVKPPNNNIYIGYKKDSTIKILPFCNSISTAAEEEFTGEVASKGEKNKIEVIKEANVERELKWASDKWTSGEFSFSIITPFGSVENPVDMNLEEKKRAVAPVIFARISFDNRKGNSDVEMIFGVEGLKRRISEATSGSYFGAADGRKYGFAIKVAKDIRELSRLDVLSSWAEGNYENHGLGRAPSLIFNVPKGTEKTYTIALATYDPAIITTGIETKFYYADLFSSLEEVLKFGLENEAYYIRKAKDRDRELEHSNLNEYRKFIIAHATHSYYASSELMKRENEEPLWILNEGEYVMMNTFDLTVDHVFWEMKFHPWTITNALDLFVEKYSYRDQLGLAFTHDMGTYDGFSPEGYSSYELPNLTGCFSYMTHEELLNWILTGAVYGLKLKDYAWLNKNKEVFKDCFESLVLRDNNFDGIMDLDSSRSRNGSEITTYDSLDVSLGQARNNLYLGVKTWAAYVVFESTFKKLGLNEFAEKAIEKAKKAAATIVSKFDHKNGYIPAVFENGNTSRIIPAVEALIYPYEIGEKEYVSETGIFSELIKTLKKHIRTVLKKGCCIDDVSGGWKLSSTSKNTWNSKIFLCQYVVKNILNMNYGESEIEWDKVHAEWQQVGCSIDGATDQVNSDDGSPRGSRLYPRLVTSILWME
ncbi:glycoside hydrolase family 52 protein [Clostridium hydrogenum]|uniref:glycoside hydrolase family 52 protein n=1 Tax=Clostridium hydrogenum TaxID=2855764 RepID=UPI001F19558A|nr:glycoside hydrolase family 52 protein [Clostridium hydrogenum]